PSAPLCASISARHRWRAPSRSPAGTMARNRRGGGAPHEIVQLARERFGARNAVYYAPWVPREKEATARAVHGAHLPQTEPFLAVHAASGCGGAEAGFAVTAERLCWKNLFEHPRQIAWCELEPRSILAGGSHVAVAGGGVQLSGDLVEGAARFFADMAARV